MTSSCGDKLEGEGVAALIPSEDGDALARILAAELHLKYDWQHIRKAGRAAADVFAALGYGTPQMRDSNG